MSIKDEVESYLKQRGTPATPLYIKKELGKHPRNSSVNHALTALTEEGKLIRTKRKGLRDKPVWYEWNSNYSAGIIGGTVNKFTVGSEPEEKSELRELYSKWLNCEKHSARYLFEAIITEIERLQKPVEKPVDAPKQIMEAWVNLYSNGHGAAHPDRDTADELSQPDRIACVRVPWVEGQYDE